VARSGYVNLLQPQDRKSRHAGDGRAAVEARAALLAAGAGRGLMDDVVRRIAGMGLPPGAVVLDLGSGTGDPLGGLAGVQTITGIGIDLSPAAAGHAARRYPDVTWVVANADRRLPILDGRVDMAMSLHGRRNPAECARVLKPQGLLVVALPAADDLIELRTLVQGAGIERDRVDGLVAEHAPWFAVQDHATVRERRGLDPSQLRALLAVTYRGARARTAERVEGLATLEVTFASEVVVLGAR
jgi:23S rRNA (guanine745-N1)-methyltransferase